MTPKEAGTTTTEEQESPPPGPADELLRPLTSAQVEEEAGRRPFGPLRWLTRDDLRRAVVCLASFLVLAVMLGPPGSPSAPLSGITGSLGHVRALYFIGEGLGAWLVLTAWARARGPVRERFAAASEGPRRLWPKWQVRYPVYGALIAGAVLIPMHISLGWQAVLVQQIGIYVLLSLGLNVVVGFAGLLDLGYVGFYAVGSYAAAYWTGALPVHPPVIVNMFWAIPLAILAAMLAGVILGAPTLRLRGDYLAIVTLGFGEIIEIVLTNLQSVTGGSSGAIGIPRFSFNLFGIHYNWLVNPMPYWYLLLGFIVLAVAGFHFLEHSRVGRAWTAIREDEVAAEATGVNVLKYKVMAFAIGASTAGFAGLLTAAEYSYINPGSYTVQLSIVVLVLVIFGGMGSLLGAIAGAAVIEWFTWYLQNHPGLFGYQPEDLLMYIGALLILMMIFRPEGIFPSKRRRREIGLAEHGVGKADALSGTAGQVA
jgi:branched-chain amino acid transport system permease protein